MAFLLILACSLGLAACTVEVPESAESAGSEETTDETTDEVQPLRLAFAFHLEGEEPLESQQAFDQYVVNIRDTADLFHENGAIVTWEAAEIVQKSSEYGTNILLELQTNGDAVGLHANGAGYVPSDPDYTLAEMQAELERQKADIDALGVTVRHVSNICSEVDWVAAVNANGFEAVTGTIDYCLKALSDPPSDVADCTNPSLCHGAYPHTVEESMSSWFAESGANWTTPVSSGLLIIPSSGAVPCAAEEAAGEESPTQCPYGDDDVATKMDELAIAVEARQPGKIHSYVFVASFGQIPDPDVIGSLLQQIKTTYVDTGMAQWTKVPDIIDLVKSTE